MAKKNKNAKPLNKTIPGGYYIGANGQAHDAHGKPIKTDGEAETEKKDNGGDTSPTNPPSQE